MCESFVRSGDIRRQERLQFSSNNVGEEMDPEEESGVPHVKWRLPMQAKYQQQIRDGAKQIEGRLNRGIAQRIEKSGLSDKYIWFWIFVRIV